MATRGAASILILILQKTARLPRFCNASFCSAYLSPLPSPSTANAAPLDYPLPRACSPTCSCWFALAVSFMRKLFAACLPGLSIAWKVDLAASPPLHCPLYKLDRGGVHLQETGVIVKCFGPLTTLACSSGGGGGCGAPSSSFSSSCRLRTSSPSSSCTTGGRCTGRSSASSTRTR